MYRHKVNPIYEKFTRIYYWRAENAEILSRERKMKP